MFSFYLFSRYKASFEVQPSDFSGCNLAIMLVAAGHSFLKSDELQRVCKFLSMKESNVNPTLKKNK